MSANHQRKDVDLQHDEALMAQLEREKRVIETRDHQGFADVVQRNRIEDQITELDTEVRYLKESGAHEEG